MTTLTQPQRQRAWASHPSNAHHLYPAWPIRVCQRVHDISCQGVRSPFVAHPTWLKDGGADAPGSPFAVLRLAEGGLANAGGAVRRRRYSGLAQQEAPRVDWEEVYQDPHRPLVVDIGCGAGRFVLLAAHHGVVPACHMQCEGQAGPSWTGAGTPGNFLGLDQHATLMARGNTWAAARGLAPRCHYLSANAQAMHDTLASYPGPVALLAVQYPDPHYRRDRHVVDAHFVKSCASLLRPGAIVLLTSDVRSTAAHMRDMFATHGDGAFALHPLHTTPGATVPDDGREVDPYLLAYGPVTANATSAVQADPAVPIHQALQEPMRAQTGVTEAKHNSATAEQSDAVGTVLPRHLLQSGLDDLVLSSAWKGSGWLAANPLGDLPTEREVFAAQVTKSPVFRVLLQRQ